MSEQEYDEKKERWNIQVRSLIVNHGFAHVAIEHSQGEAWLAEALGFIAHGYNRADRYEHAKRIGMLFMDALHDAAEKELRNRG